MQHQALGQSFRNTYVSDLGFLPKSLDAKLVRVRSTDVERTLLSAYNFLEGLYPSEKGEVFNIETIDNDVDNGMCCHCGGQCVCLYMDGVGCAFVELVCCSL